MVSEWQWKKICKSAGVSICLIFVFGFGPLVFECFSCFCVFLLDNVYGLLLMMKLDDGRF